MNIHHIAFYKRTPPDNHAGGVPLFGDYLRQVFGALLWSWSDYPKPLPRVDEPTAAQMLGRWLLHSGKLIDCCALVVDGFWGRGLTDKEVQAGTDSGHPTISVAHGTWRGIARATGSESATKRLGDAQAEEYRRLPVVAVSEYCAHEIRELYGVEPVAVIRNGVDTAEFRPREKSARMRPVVIYPSDAPAKGGRVVAELKQRRPDLEFRVLGAGIGQEPEAMAQGDVYLCPSLSDGCSYAGLQALACGLPVVTSPVGLFADMLAGTPQADLTEGILNGFHVGTVVAAGTTESWSHALSLVLSDATRMGQAARTWAERFGSLTRWESDWRRLLADWGVT